MIVYTTIPNLCKIMLMALFSKKTTLVHHITYMGIMTAINLIFIVLATFVPFLMLFLILLLPFASTIVSYYCQKRYYIIYAAASIGLCLIFSITDTIFYIVPAVITGFILGLLLEKKAHPFWLVLSSSIIEAGLTFAFIPLINLIGNTDIVYAFLSIFKLTNFVYQTELVYLFVYFISLLQCILTNFVLLNDAKKIGININNNVNSYSLIIIGLELSIALSFTFGLFFAPLAFVFLEIAIYFALFLIIDLLLSKKPIVYIVLSLLLISSFIGFILLYKTVAAPTWLLLINLFPLAIGITSFTKNCLLKYESNI